MLMKTTTVALGSHFDEFVQASVLGGRYTNASEVIRAGLRRLEENEQKIAALRAAGSRRMSVTLLSGETLSLPISDAMTPLILDYIHALQLGSWLRNQEERP